MLTIITNNPYRILGVCSNSPQKDVASNRSKMNAFLKVGKEVSFQMDLNELLPHTQRTLESVDKAQSDLTLPKDKVKYALFWFIKLTSLDDIAINNLTNGDSEKAIQIWLKRGTMSSLLNLAIIAFTDEDYETAINNITTIIHDDDYRQELVDAVAGQNLSITEGQLAQLFIDTLFECNPEEDWRHIFINNGKSADDDEYIASKLINPLIEKINLAINEAKQTKGKGSAARYNAGLELINKSENFIKDLNDLLDKDNLKYQNTVDKLANEILQCGIDYYNESNDDDSAEKALKIQGYALNIAVGSITKDRCKENVNILNQIISELPPKEVIYYDKLIKEKFSIFNSKPDKIEHGVELIKGCIPYLMTIKEILGPANSYYLKVSTAVVAAALSNLIEEFNSIMNDSIQFRMAVDKFSTMMQITNLLSKSWEAVLYMDKLDMTPEFKRNRYSRQRNALKNQVEGVISIYGSASLDMRSESQIFRDCKTISDYKKYKSLFPNGKYEIKANGCISVLEAQQADDNTFNSCKSVADYKRYLSKYPNGRNVDKTKKIIDDEEMWQRCTSADSRTMYKEYLAKYPYGRHKSEAEKKVSPCYIATMVYGNYDHPQVYALRQFRDEYLQNRKWGLAFIKIYYRYSPDLVDYLKGKKTINILIRNILDKFIKHLNK